MGYKLIMEDEPIELTSIVAVIYAPPGAGKTSLTFTSEKPLLFDFDDGVKRAVNRKGTVQFKSWTEVIKFTESDDFTNFDPQTLIFDTADNMLNDFIGPDVAKEKGNSRSNGALTQSGYGAMKHVFDAFFAKFKGRKDIIFICHEQEDKRDDKAVLRPKITGGAYNIVIQKADIIGYIDVTTEGENQIRKIDFNPSETRYAKNFPEFPVTVIPHYSDPSYPTFFADLISKAKEKMVSMSASQLEAVERVKELTDRVTDVKTLAEANAVQKDLYELSKIYQAQAQKELDDKFIELYGAQIAATKTMDELNGMNETLKSLKERFKTGLTDVYHTVYKKHWHTDNTNKAKTAEDFTKLVADLINSNSEPLPSEMPKSGLTASISNELMGEAEKKGFTYNKPLKKFESSGAAKPDEPKKNVKAEEAPSETKEETSEMSQKEAEFIKQIGAAKVYSDLEPLEEAIGSLVEPHRRAVMKVFFAKLDKLEKAQEAK